MASEDLLKKAVATFNALSPEQQAEMLEEQRQSWVRGNIGLSRDERGMTSTVMHRPAPAATDGGFASFCRFNVETYLLDTWLHMHHDRKPVSDEQVIEEVRHNIIQGRISHLKRHIERMEVILRAKEANHV